jgi:hypothetical protein
MREKCIVWQERLGKATSSSNEREEGSKEVWSGKDNVEYPRLTSQAAQKIVTSLCMGWTVK